LTRGTIELEISFWTKRGKSGEEMMWWLWMQLNNLISLWSKQLSSRYKIEPKKFRI